MVAVAALSLFLVVKNDVSKKKTIHKRYRRPIKDLEFSPWRESEFTKQCLQQGHCQAQPMKARR
jgi:hypothetical protein